MNSSVARSRWIQPSSVGCALRGLMPNHRRRPPEFELARHRAQHTDSPAFRATYMPGAFLAQAAA
ncbi:hypothetical protein XAXN_16425 [Xanthomonas axonopodis]|uniref:Uncharacterized protein n=1 Tax=Xanthomonas axonopodis TaxID=53413 RepID=A0A0P6VS00_9XANT|nr:hypothetical protein XAXN_16425 [Xanthomonas axonopodis]